jgi:hypothetical protein
MTGREWWNSRWLLFAAVLATAIPLLWPTIPPFADVPGHMASYHVSVALAQSPALQRFFTFHWQLVGNLGVDLAVVPLAALVGVEMATKLVVIAIPVLTALALLLIARRVHGRLPATALAALPLVYNYPFVFGFVNYSLSAALALLGLALALYWPSDRRPVLRAAVFAAIAVVVWISHAIGWVMLGAMCGAAELQARRAAGQNWGRCLIGTALTYASLIAPIVLIVLGPHADKSSVSGWLAWHDLARGAIEQLRDRWAAWDVISLLALLALAGAALLGIGRLRLAPAALWPALALLALFLFAPLELNGSMFVNTRIAPYALALAIVAIDTRALAVPRQAALAGAAALFLVARLAGNTLSFAEYDASYTRELAALDHIPRGASVLTFTEMPCQKWFKKWRESRIEHLAGMATVRRDAFTNVLWDIKGLHVMENRMARAGWFRSDPSEFVSSVDHCPFYGTPRAAVAGAPLGAFTHLWLIDVPAAARPHDPRLVPIWSAGDSALYRIAASQDRRHRDRDGRLANAYFTGWPYRA